jgi:tRNA-dihydrouridine synthase A
MAQIEQHLKSVDGVMIGRAAYGNPWFLADAGRTRAEVALAMYEYAKRAESLRHVTRHMLGLYHGLPRARLWRQMLSDSARLRHNRPELILDALDAVEGRNQGQTPFAEPDKNVVCP